MSEAGLRRSITLSQAIALYVGAVVGGGVLILPGTAASAAGPSALFAWAFDCLLGLPLALTFAALAARHPDAGGVASFTERAFGPAFGAVVGWFYFIAAATGQIIVPLSGAYYAAGALGWGQGPTFILAAVLLTVAVAANCWGLRLSGRLQLILSGTVAAMLLLAAWTAFPRVQAANFTPLFPHGPLATGRTAVLIFFAFCGWEAIAHLASEFRDPARDIPRSTLWAVLVVTVIYLGIAFATIGTAAYGSPDVDRVAVARLISDSLGVGAGFTAAGMALLISLGTANAFVAGTSRLGYALGRDGAFPAWFATLNPRGVPVRSVLAVGVYAGAGLLLAYIMGWGAETFLVVSNSLSIATYLIGTAAGIRLLRQRDRLLAWVAFGLCAIVFPFAGGSIMLTVGVAIASLAYFGIWGKRFETVQEGIRQ